MQSTDNEQGADRPRLTRLSVMLNQESAADLRHLADLHGRSFTETIRRMIAVARYLDDELEQNRVLQVVDRERNEVRELVIR